MAHYQASVRTKLSPADAFARMARVECFSAWDPGILRSEQTRGSGPGVGAAYDLLVDAVPKQTFRYRVTEFEAPKRYRMLARTTFFTSDDEVRVEEVEAGSRVIYAAELELSGVLRVFDPFLRPVFRVIGDRAARGLATYLDGVLER